MTPKPPPSTSNTPIKVFDNLHMQFHWRLADQSGRAVAIEYLEGELHVIENPLGVITNSPNFTWHLTNLTNYVNMSPYAWPAVEIENLTLKPSSLGSGMNGLPGDFTSPSRFVRAVAFQETAAPSAKADDGVKTAFHILNLFDSNDHDIEYFYASRLPGEPADGIEDVHFHVFEPRQVRLYGSLYF